MKTLNTLGYAVVFCMLWSCQKPPDLADSLPKHTFLTLDELDENVRLSFRGPDEEHSQAITDDARKDESLFVLLEPQAVRVDRALDRLDRGFEGGEVSFCVKGCARLLRFAGQSLWVKGEVCHNEPVATFSSFERPPPPSNPETVYSTSAISIPGQLELLDQVICYETYFYHEGDIICTQACLRCGPGEFTCDFISPSLVVKTEMPEGTPTSVSQLDCDPTDFNTCGVGVDPGQPPI